MMLTRWHEGDLAGVFALEEDGETPKRGWCALRLPAVAEPGGNDRLGREVGQSLCPQIASKDFLETRLREDPVWFSCIYQGSPIHAQGNFFKKTYEGAGGQLTFHHHRYDPSSRRYRGPGEAVIDAAAESTVHFMVLDLATSKRTKADWTVFSHWAFDPWLNTLVLVDRVKDRFSTDEHSGVLTDFVT
ncbi:MAG: hypothetical protein GY937_05945, partial [bacterium]|nr:hypothetical protein [bacterium]